MMNEQMQKNSAHSYRNKSGGTGVFMMEMIMVVFFFILCASTCIMVFAKSDRMSKLARDTNRGVAAAESVAEVWKAEGFEGLKNRFDAREYLAKSDDLGRGSCVISWDADWNPYSHEPDFWEEETLVGENLDRRSAAASYYAKVTWMAEEDLSTAQVSVIRGNDQEQLISLEAKRYLGRKESLPPLAEQNHE